MEPLEAAINTIAPQKLQECTKNKTCNVTLFFIQLICLIIFESIKVGFYVNITGTFISSFVQYGLTCIKLIGVNKTKGSAMLALDSIRCTFCQM